MADIVAKNICHIPKIGRPLASITQWLTISFVRTKFGKKLSAATSIQFPLGYFLIAVKPK